MKVFNLYIFDKYTTLMYYAEWNRTKKSGLTQEEVNKKKNFFTVRGIITPFFIFKGGETHVWDVVIHQVIC